MSRNCWEVMGCEKYPGGAKVDERGPCPASNTAIATGINNGQFGGRACWAIDKTLCAREPFEDFSDKLEFCHRCVFYALVAVEEGNSYWNTEMILTELQRYQVF